MKTLIALLMMCSIAMAGVMNGDTGNSGSDGTVTVTIKGGVHGDYRVTFEDKNGTSTEVKGTPTPGGKAGETEDTDWARMPGGDEYRIHKGRLQKREKDGDIIRIRISSHERLSADEEMDGTLPYIYHVPGPKPGPPVKGDTPPELEKDPLPPLSSNSGQ